MKLKDYALTKRRESSIQKRIKLLTSGRDFLKKSECLNDLKK
jgi:hypothetical protein